ncbi:hypothetical protein [Sodalis glossinidius]
MVKQAVARRSGMPVLVNNGEPAPPEASQMVEKTADHTAAKGAAGA